MAAVEVAPSTRLVLILRWTSPRQMPSRNYVKPAEVSGCDVFDEQGRRDQLRRFTYCYGGQRCFGNLIDQMIVEGAVKCY